MRKVIKCHKDMNQDGKPDPIWFESTYGQSLDAFRCEADFNRDTITDQLMGELSDDGVVHFTMDYGMDGTPDVSMDMQIDGTGAVGSFEMPSDSMFLDSGSLCS